MFQKSSFSSPPSPWELTTKRIHGELNECKGHLTEILQILRTQTKNQNQTNHEQTPPNHERNRHQRKLSPRPRPPVQPNFYEEEIDDGKGEIVYADQGELLSDIEEINEPLQEEGSEGKDIEAKHENEIVENSNNGNMLVLHAQICPSKDQQEKLNPSTLSHVQPYELQWLSNGSTLQVTKQVLIPFSIGRNHVDEVPCDIIPMDTCHLLLDSPCQFHESVAFDGRQNTCSFELEDKTITLAPLKPSRIHQSSIRTEHKKKKEYKILSGAKIERFNQEQIPALELIVTRGKEKGKIKVRKKWQAVLKGAYKEFKLHDDFGGISTTFNAGSICMYLEEDNLQDLRSNPLQPGENDAYAPSWKLKNPHSGQERIMGEGHYKFYCISAQVEANNPAYCKSMLNSAQIDSPSKQPTNLHMDQTKTMEKAHYPFSHQSAQTSSKEEDNVKPIINSAHEESNVQDKSNLIKDSPIRPSISIGCNLLRWRPCGLLANGGIS